MRLRQHARDGKTKADLAVGTACKRRAQRRTRRRVKTGTLIFHRDDHRAGSGLDGDDNPSTLGRVAHRVVQQVDEDLQRAVWVHEARERFR